MLFQFDMIHIQIRRATSQNCMAWLAHAAATATQPEKNPSANPIWLCNMQTLFSPSPWEACSVFHFSEKSPASWICTWERWKSNWESSWGPMNLSLLQAPSVHCRNTPWVVWQNRILINYNLKNANLLQVKHVAVQGSTKWVTVTRESCMILYAMPTWNSETWRLDLRVLYCIV